MYNFIIDSDDNYLSNDKITEIKNNYKDYELLYVDLDDESVFSLVDELSTISLFSTLKMVVCKNPSILLKSNNTSAKEQLLKIMHDPDNLNVLVYLFENIKIDDNDYYKNIKKASSYFRLRLKDISLEDYANNYLASNMFRIDKEAITLLVNNTNNLESLVVAIDKLLCYKYEEKHIRISDVQLLVNKPLDNNVYDLINAVIDKNKLLVFEIYNDLKKHSVTPSVLISMLLSKFQEMYDVSVLLRARLNQQDISDLFKVSTGRAYYMIKNSKSKTIEDISKNLDLLNELDLKIKQGLIDQAVGLELYLLR